MDLRRPYLVWTVLPVLPLIAGFGVLQMLGAGPLGVLAGEVGGNDYHAAARGLRFTTALVIYLAVGTVHVAACVAVVATLAPGIARLPGRTRRRTLLVLGASIAILVAVNVAARIEGVLFGALAMTYRSVCAVLVEGLADLIAGPGLAVPAAILPPSCDAPGLSPFAWLAVVPYLAGLIATATASAVTSTALDGAADDAGLLAGADRIDRAFQATAFVLVTSTLSLMLFYQLPLSIVAEPGARDLVSGYAQAMTMFWGALFTLTLLAVFGPGHLLLRARSAGMGGSGGLSEEIVRRSLRKRVADLLTVLSPLLLGSAGAAMDFLLGAL
jgi:hypothetical protein